MSMILNDTEERALREALDIYLPELRYELSRIKRERDRHHLVELERTLSGLRSRLEGLPGAVPHLRQGGALA